MIQRTESGLRNGLLSMSVVDSEKKRDPLASLRIPREPERPRADGQRSFWRWLAPLLILFLLFGGGGYWLRSSGQRQWNWAMETLRPGPEVGVTKVRVETGRAGDALVVATGYIESYRQANIGARAAGRVQSVNVEEGSPVKEGEIIAVLDHEDIEAALAAARAGVLGANAELREQEVEIARAKKELERLVRLRETNSTTEAEYDRVYFLHEAAVARLARLEAALALAEAKVRETEQFKENMIVRAPFDGTVISKDAEVGESILPGGMGEASGRGSVATVADLNRLEVACDVKEDYISRVTQDSPAEVAVDAVPNRRYVGRVRKVIPMGDRARSTIKVKVAILDADEMLFPEMSAKVYFLPTLSEQAQTQVPERRIFCDSKAVVESDGKHFVWELVDDRKRVQQAPVVLGEQRDGTVEILEGLSGGESIVPSPPPTLQEGQRVRLKE